MKKDFSKSWISSVQPRKQRKFRFNALLHLRSKFMGVALSEELWKKYGRRNITVRKGDKVKVLRGEFKGRVGKINLVDRKSCKVRIDGVEVVKKEGTKKPTEIHTSNLLIIELFLDDKKRVKSLEKRGENKNG